MSINFWKIDRIVGCISLLINACNLSDDSENGTIEMTRDVHVLSKALSANRYVMSI